MSESEVSQIRDEDVLRRMWQQTEDFGRKKEIRAHMYKLREERLRDLYSPEPALQGKGCEFSTAHAQGHGQSFADQSFQSMKSKEVRDASSPPKEFSYRNQDLKELSNAGWNVESEDRKTDDGRTQVKFVNANIEGRYDVEGGQGQFAAVDRQRRAVTEHQDANSSLHRDETSSDTAAHEHVVRQTDDGSRISSTTSSSNTSSKFQQVTSKTHEVPIEDDYDLRRTHDTNRNEKIIKTTNNDYEQSLRTNNSSTLRKNDSSTAELVSRKVEYPDDNTKVIVETRLLPDGTRVTSTRREFRVPAQSSHSERHSSQSTSYSSQHKSEYRDSTSNTRHMTENRPNDIVDSQRNVDDNDFKRQLREYTSSDHDDHSIRRHHVSRTNKKLTDHSQTSDEFSQKRYETRINSKVIDQHQSTTNRNDHTHQRRTIDLDQSNINRDDYTQTQQSTVDRRNDYRVEDTDRHHTTTTRDQDIQRNVVKETRHVSDSEKNIHNITRERQDNEEIIRHASRNRMVPDDKDREIPRDRNIPIDKMHGVPKDSTPNIDTTHDIPRDRTVPVDATRDVPRNETAPEKLRAPKDGTIPEDRPRDIPKDRTTTNEKVQHVKKDTTVEEVIERKTSSDHYQTTYQNDFQSRKVSTDWSPTHQAWASTLRSDTPSTTRPSTRASSPGSKTFKSSTSSLRSSVSPDKSYKKPSSRGGSPSKVDRYSPTRTVTSDRYSSTHSTHSVTEERMKKNASPERKPPSGRSPARPGYSPDRKPQDSYRQRPSVSPEKSPEISSERPNLSLQRPSVSNDGRPSTTSPLGKKEGPKSPMRSRQSPERKLAYQPCDENPSDTYSRTSPYRSTSSPDRKPFDHPNRSSPRSSPSPDRRSVYQKPTDSPEAGHPRTSSSYRPSYPTDSPRKSDTSPDKKPGSQQPSKQQPDWRGNKHPQDSLIQRPSTSPDRKPSYMRPTAASQPDEKPKIPSNLEYEPDRKNATNQIKEDHYRFVDEETKVYSHTDKMKVDNKVVEISTIDDSPRHDKGPSPKRHVLEEDSPDYCKAPTTRESPFSKGKSPTKNTVIISENDKVYGRADKTVETNIIKITNITSNHDKETKENTTTKRIHKNNENPEGNSAPRREISPSKYGTYDKKKTREEVDTSVITTMTSDDTNDIRHESLTRRDKTSPKKAIDIPSSPGKKSPRDSVSPMKSPTKDNKHTTDFITTERTTEEVNKKNSTKDRPRQLVTPSSSPTRKPKTTETEPSTGQSSPTTSVSGFIYFGSPRTEKPVVTDLDEFYPDSETPAGTAKRPESLNVNRTPSPSKIPCRSPSPEKHISTTKDSLPRKSSLKKPSTEFNQASPVEKPPTSFRVSPTDDKPDVLDHKVVKKNRSSEPETGEPKFSEKPKPPLQRRETYDDRCKKILGLVDDTTTETIGSETIKDTRKRDSCQNSPSVSPCDSPVPKESALFSSYTATKKTGKVDVTDFINHERQDLTKTTITQDQQKTRILSRDSSPTKLRDIITNTTLITDRTSKDEVEEDTVTKIVKKHSSPRQSPEKDSPKDTTQKRPDENTGKKRVPSPSKESRPTKNISARSDLSPERKPVDKYPKDTSSTRTSSEKVPDYKKTTTTTSTTTVTSNNDASSTLDDVQNIIKITKTSQPTRVLESPTKESPRLVKKLPQQTEHPHTTLPSNQQPKDGSPVKSDFPSHSSEPNNVRHLDSHPRKSPEKVPGYMKSTTAVTSKFDSHYTAEEVNETSTRAHEQKEPKTKTSPTPQTPRAKSPTKSSQPSDSSSKRPDTSPQRKPAQVALAKQSDTKQEVPGYMRSTKTASTKVDKITVSEDVQETIKATVENKHISSGSVSPAQKPSQPKSSSERTPSPTKPSRPSNTSIDKKSSSPVKESPTKFQPSSPVKESPTKKPEPKHTTASSPTRPSPQKLPSYMKTTASMTLKHENDTSEYDVTTTEDSQETITSTIFNKKSQHTHESTDRSSPEHLRTTFQSRPSTYDLPNRLDSPEHSFPSKEGPTGKHIYPKDTSPTRGETPGYMKTTTTMNSKFETTSTTEDIEDSTTFKHAPQKYPSDIASHENPEVKRHLPTPSKLTDKLPRTSTTSPDRKLSKPQVKDSVSTENKHPKHTSGKTSASPEIPSYMKPTVSIISKFDTTTTTHETEEAYKSKVVEPKSPSPRKLTTTGRQSPEREPRETQGYLSKPEEPRQLRTPSPTKKTTTITETNTDFIMSEREQEILNKVQKTLRKLSPERKEKSPSRERSPDKTTTSLQDLDIITSKIIQTDESTNENLTEIVEEQLTIASKVPRPTQLKNDKPKDKKAPSKPTSRNVSPIKRASTTPSSNKADKILESPTNARSFSPKKPVSHVDRPQSPQQSKTMGVKPREHIPSHLTRKSIPATLSTTRIERLTTDVIKTTGVSKQNVSTKTMNRSIPSPTGKVNELDTKRTPMSKKDNVSPKKDAVTRTASDIAMKPKKTSSPQRMKSKPEIQVSDMSTKSPKSQKPTIKEPRSRLPSKPKSATSLNTSVDEDDIIIDVQQSKSSRENSPDRICPTPINFADDIGVPRFPDEVSEPDDELVKRNHHTIHETESVVDDIVEICEDEELFVKRSDMEVITEHDDSLLSVNEKVNKFTSIHSAKKPKDTTTTFKDTERRVHSDFIDENLRSDECLLTVSEKVNKFAKGPRETKDSHSPSRKITDEYDKDTVYTDDYTKLSVNDKAHLFVETAESIKTTKIKPAQKVERPDLSHVGENLKSDDCLLSVSDKVNKFVKTAEQYFTDTQEVEEKETKIKQQHEKILNKIVDDEDEETHITKETLNTQEIHTINGRTTDHPQDSSIPRAREPKPSQPKAKDYGSPNKKPVDRAPAVKITTLRSSEAVKKAKALFENIASTQKTTQKESTQTTKSTKLTDIGVIKKSPENDSTTVYPSVQNVAPKATAVDSKVDVPHTDHKPQYSLVDEKPSRSPDRHTTQLPEVHRAKSPMRQRVEVTATKTVLSRYPAATRAESPRYRPESPKPHTESPRQRTESPRQRTDSDKADKVPGYLRPTKTSQIKEETKVEEAEVSSRRGSGKFGVELRRTSVERSTVSSERRRSVEHHQPCIEDIFDLDLLEQMLEKVVGYEQRRRIRAQIRVAKNQSEHLVETNTYTKTTRQTTSVPKARSPDRKMTKSPERGPKSTPQRTSTPERHNKSTPQKTVPDRTQPKEPTMNGYPKDSTKTATVTRKRPQSPEKPAPKSTPAPRTTVRQPSPDKRRTTSPSKAAPKPKGTRFNEYASAYMKKVGLDESDKIKFADTKTKKTIDSQQTLKHERQQKTVQEFTTTKSFTERTSSKDVIEFVQTNGKRSLSPEQRQSPERKVQFPDHEIRIPEHKAHSPDHRAYSPERQPHNLNRKPHSPERKVHSPERLHQRTPSPDFKRPKTDTVKETIIKTVYDIEKKIPSKPVQDEKPAWVTNRNLKKITSESRKLSSKKIENEKPKYRASSPSKIIAKPIDVITSSYGPGPLDADGKPLFGIKALRNGGSNFQVKGTVIRQEFHTRNGGEPEGTVSVTAYSSQPEELEQLLASQGAEPPSRIHGLAAITTTKKFGGDTGNTLSNVHTKEDRSSLEQFTHHDRRVEHLESSYDRTHKYSGDVGIEQFENTSDITDNTKIEDITGSTRRIDSKTENRQDRTDRSRKEEKVADVKRQKIEERREKMERREDKKTVRQSSVKSLTEKYIKSANESGKSDRSAYPKAGLILRTTTMRDSISSDEAPPEGLTRTESEHSLCSVDDTVVTTTTERTGDGIRTTTTKSTHHHHHPTVTTHTRGSTLVSHHEPVITTKKTVISQEPVITTRKTMIVSQEPVTTTKRTTVVIQEPVTHSVTQGRQGSTVTTERSFLDSSSKVTGVQDILTRMKNADIVIQEGDTTEDSEARALLNKFLGATVLMAGMQGYVAEQTEGKVAVHQESVSSTGGKQVSSRSVQDLDLDQCWDERLLKKLLDECTDYEQRRRLRARIRTLMAEQEACASAVTEALGVCGASETEGGEGAETREEEEVTVTSSVRRDSSDKTVSSTTTTKTSKVIEMTRPAPKPVSPFAKFRQLEKQNSTNSPNSPKTPQSPGSPSQPYFKFTDPALQSSALTIKERLLQWCRDKTRDYENVKLENFSTSWSDGLAFCALVHHFLPTAFDYSKLTPDRRRHNFTLAFKVADEKAGIYPLLDVDDMVSMRKPDWKCVFTYVQAIYRRFKDEP